MDKKIKPIRNIKGVCFKCLQKKPVTTYTIYRDNYGSSFDNNHTYLQICDDCKPNDIDKWFNENPKITNYYTEYKYEKNIINFVKTFPIQGRELFWNRCSDGACSYPMKSQDWIDMELGILPDKKYKEYGMYSPSEIKAYNEKFPTCEYPINRIYNDNSTGCWCPFNANGEEGQIASSNISSECYYCKYYKQRETPIKSIKDEDFYDYKLYIKGKLMQNKLEDKFKNL